MNGKKNKTVVIEFRKELPHKSLKDLRLFAIFLQTNYWKMNKRENLFRVNITMNYFLWHVYLLSPSY